MGRYGGKTSKVDTFQGMQNSCGFKQSIILCDFKPGTRNITLNQGVYRVAVVGGGGGSSPMAGNAVGGFSEFLLSGVSILSASGGKARSAGGVGSDGDVNTSGSSTILAALNTGGGASGHRLGSAPDKTASTNEKGGCGWSSLPVGDNGGMSAVDGFGLGIDPGTPMSVNPYSSAVGATGLYGHGATNYGTSTAYNVPGIGGGGCGVANGNAQNGGIGGGGAGAETNNYPGSGGGYAEKIITVTAAVVYSYTVGAGGFEATQKPGGPGCVIIERLA